MFLPIKVSVRNYAERNVGIILLEVWSPSGEGSGRILRTSF